jgi:uncharacterized protein
MHRSLPWIFASVALLVGCTGDDSASSNTISDAGTNNGGDAGDASTPAGFSVRGSVQQIAVWKAPPGTTIQVQDSSGKVVTSAKTDTLGSILFRKLTPGDYAVVGSDLVPPEVHQPIHVMGIPDSQPAQDFYTKQTLVQGLNYITTRDGTTLSAYVTFPGPAANGPYPTVVNYSGYNPSQPGAPVTGFAVGNPQCTSLPVLCDAPNDPSALIAALNGYATVGVNMRGTGCSGGAYDYFEDLQLLDGYDIIETVAAQSWVDGHRVGMTGLSYPGISELFVAEEHPPSLAAITPLSVIGGTYSTARPGGIFNDGFALDWITNVVDKAAPYGQGWEQGQIDKGDKVCADNQLLHGQKVDAVTEAQQTPYYTDDLVGRVDPTTFAHTINVPVFLGDGWQDEQTGPFFFTLLDQFTSAPIKRFTMYNGVHIDGFAPQMLVEWKAFLDIYVAHKVPVISAQVRALAPTLFSTIFKESMQIPPDRFASYPTWEAAKAAYEAEDDYRVIFENGNGDATKLGAPIGTTDLRFASWPHPATAPVRMYFETDGSMGATAPTDAFAASSFTLDPAAGHRGILASGGNVWDPLPAYSWMQPAAGKDVVFESAALSSDLVMLGSASADLWIRSPVDDADLEVNVMEIRPDGQEMFVQAGWLRASLRKLSTTATDLWPEHTYRQPDEALLVPGEWNLARVGIPAFQHTFRTGSRIRVTVDTPGDSRAAWQFALKTYPSTVSYDVGHDATHSSSINLPVLGGLASTTPIPPCPSLRGQQCRTYVAYTNVASTP